MKYFILILIIFPFLSFAQSTTMSVEYTANDWAEETVSDGSMYMTSGDLELCYDGHQQIVGVQFENVKIPQGVVISDSYIQFKTDETSSGTGFTITITAEDNDNASDLSGTDDNLSDRQANTTTASVNWNPSAWNTIGEEGSAQRTPSLNTIIQELVNRTGWAQSNIVFIITANNGSSTNTRIAEVDPILHIDYEAEIKDVLYYVSDSDNDLYKIDVNTEAQSSIGDNNVTNIEAIANWPSQSGYTLFAANGGTLGTLSYGDGSFTSIGDIDNGGTVNGSDGPITLDDVDGLGFDARTGKLWASDRRSGHDVLFQIDKTTGNYVPNAFGAGNDYVVIDGAGVYETFDDIAVSPINSKIYGVSNNGSMDQLIEINPLTGDVIVNTAITGADDIEGLSFGNDGTLYGSSGTSDTLYEINPVTGVAIYTSILIASDVEALAALVEAANIISGTLWTDVDTDGIKDGGENSGITGVDIELWDDVNNNNLVDGGDKLLQTVTTDASGNYKFEFAAIGNLAIKVNTTTLPLGYALTTDNNEDATFTDFDNTDSGNNFGAYTGADCDGDGIPDFSEGTGDTDGDGVDDKCDLDSDNDGIIDSEEGTADDDGDGIKNYLDLDSDNDGIPDAIEANGGVAPTNYSSSTGRIGGSDSDGDGIMNAVDDGSTSKLINYDTDGDGHKDYVDLDSDNDGIVDLIEVGGADSDGDGHIDSYSDSNTDGYHDAYATSALTIYNNDIVKETVDGTEILPNYRDIDSDGDSIDDTHEGYGPGAYTTISVLLDNDGDGILNKYDINSGGEPILPHDYDTDGTPDYLDLDSDNDGALDIEEGNNADNSGGADSSPSGVDDNKNGLDDNFDQACVGSSMSEYTATGRSEENDVNGTTDIDGSSDIELNYEDQSQTVGIRFTGVTLEQGVTVSEAYIQFQADESSSGSVTLTIKGEDEDNSEAFSESGTLDVSGRTKTSASSVWSPASWTSGDEGSAQKTGNLKSIIQEIVNRGGWSNGNAITFVITGTGTNYRTAENNPILVITTADGLKYDCGSDIALQDFDSNSKEDWRDVGAVLPVSLLSFNAALVNGYTEINWATASEENNDYFLVQKSDDGINFETIDEVMGAGNSNIRLSYETVDYSPINNVAYYRLKQVDYDGQSSLSDIVSVRNSSVKSVNVYPNPSDGNIKIETTDDIEIVIYSASGQEIARYINNANSVSSYDLSNYKKGIYFISYIINNETKIEKLIIK